MQDIKYQSYEFRRGPTMVVKFCYALVLFFLREKVTNCFAKYGTGLELMHKTGYNIQL